MNLFRKLASVYRGGSNQTLLRREELRARPSIEGLEERQLLTTYFVKAGGNDVADGQSDATAWATIARVNAAIANASDPHAIQPGDIIEFRRGDTFYLPLDTSQSPRPQPLSFNTPRLFGTLPYTITIRDYGTAPASPIINATDPGTGKTGTALSFHDVANIEIDNLTVMGTYDPSIANLAKSRGNGIEFISDLATNLIALNGVTIDNVHVSGFGAGYPAATKRRRRHRNSKLLEQHDRRHSAR